MAAVLRPALAPLALLALAVGAAGHTGPDCAPGEPARAVCETAGAECIDDDGRANGKWQCVCPEGAVLANSGTDGSTPARCPVLGVPVPASARIESVASYGVVVGAITGGALQSLRALHVSSTCAHPYAGHSNATVPWAMDPLRPVVKLSESAPLASIVSVALLVTLASLVLYTAALGMMSKSKAAPARQGGAPGVTHVAFNEEKYWNKEQDALGAVGLPGAPISLCLGFVPSLVPAVAFTFASSEFLAPGQEVGDAVAVATAACLAGLLLWVASQAMLPEGRGVSAGGGYRGAKGAEEPVEGWKGTLHAQLIPSGEWVHTNLAVITQHSVHRYYALLQAYTRPAMKMWLAEAFVSHIVGVIAAAASTGTLACPAAMLGNCVAFVALACVAYRLSPYRSAVEGALAGGGMALQIVATGAAAVSGAVAPDEPMSWLAQTAFFSASLLLAAQVTVRLLVCVYVTVTGRRRRVEKSAQAMDLVRRTQSHAPPPLPSEVEPTMSCWDASFSPGTQPHSPVQWQPQNASVSDEGLRTESVSGSSGPVSVSRNASPRLDEMYRSAKGDKNGCKKEGEKDVRSMSASPQHAEDRREQLRAPSDTGSRRGGALPSLTDRTSAFGSPLLAGASPQESMGTMGRRSGRHGLVAHQEVPLFVTPRSSVGTTWSSELPSGNSPTVHGSHALTKAEPHRGSGRKKTSSMHMHLTLTSVHTEREKDAAEMTELLSVQRVTTGPLVETPRSVFLTSLRRTSLDNSRRPRTPTILSVGGRALCAGPITPPARLPGRPPNAPTSPGPSAPEPEATLTDSL